MTRRKEHFTYTGPPDREYMATQLLTPLDESERDLAEAETARLAAKEEFESSKEHVEKLRNALHALGVEVEQQSSDAP